MILLSGKDEQKSNYLQDAFYVNFKTWEKLDYNQNTWAGLVLL